MRTLLLAAALAGLVVTADVSYSAVSAHSAEPAVAPRAMPFHVGEKLTYQAKLNFVNVGSATMSVEDIEDIRGQATYHTIFDIQGRVLFFHVNDHYESWFDTTDMVSLHHVQHIDQPGHRIDRVYDFYPDRQIYVRNDTVGRSVAMPLDEGSFIYFLRSIPLEVGKTYSFDRYYHLERNPVVIKVVRKEHISVPAGEFDAIVVDPVIKSKGLFSENGHAEVWLADDSARTLLRLKSKLPMGTLYLELKQAEYTMRR